MAEARLAELVAALSLRIDLGFGQPMEHVLRQCLISLRLADRLGLDDEQRADVYYTALLINVGCHSDAHEQAKWFGDDFASKAIKYDHEPRSLRMVARRAQLPRPRAPPLHRFRLGLEFVVSGRREVDGMIESHSQIARMLGEHRSSPGRCSTHSPARTRALGRARVAGRPARRPGSTARIAHCAVAILEVANRVDGVAGATRMARQRPRQTVRSAGRRRSCTTPPRSCRSTTRRVGAPSSRQSPGSRCFSTTRGDPRAGGDRELHRPEVAVLPGTRARSSDLAAEAGAGLGRLTRWSACAAPGLVHDLAASACRTRSSTSRARSARRAGAAAVAGVHHRTDASAVGRTGAARASSSRRGSDACWRRRDAYQAMREPRPHREALDADRAAAELRIGPFETTAMERARGGGSSRRPQALTARAEAHAA